MQKYPKFRNEAGFTLVETMASLALLSLVIVLASGFLMNSNLNKDSVATSIELQQQTNKLVTAMQRDYYEQSGTGDLAFSGDTGSIAIRKLVVNGTEREPVSPLTGIDFDQALSLDVTTVTETGQTLTIQTSWRPERARALSLAP